MPNERRPPPPLDAASLDALALRYVERFATTRGKLAAYLKRKVRERGWDGPPPDPQAIAERMAGFGYVDDRAFAEAKARALVRRGYGTRRLSQALHAAHVAPADAEAALEGSEEQAFDSAIAYARRRRFGPFAAAAPDDRTRERQIAAMLRAGHSFSLARRIISVPLGEVPERDT